MLRGIGIVGREDATLAHRQRLARMETPARRVTVRTDRPSTIRGPDGAGCVFDDGDPPTPERGEAVDVGREAHLVDRNHRLGAWSDTPKRIRQIDVPRRR